MKNCPFCNAELEDSVRFCRNCGTAQPGPDYLASGVEYVTPETAAPEPQADPWDHTGEFEEKDAVQHRLYAMLVYLLGLVGVVVAMLGAKESEYAAFHVRQGLKLAVVDGLVLMAAALLCWTVIVPVAAVIVMAVLAVVRLICFFRVCQSKAVEVPIIRSLGFLK